MRVSARRPRLRVRRASRRRPAVVVGAARGRRDTHAARSRTCVRAPQTVEVAFVKNGWIIRVDRVVPKGMTPQELALRELTQGPTKVERRRGIRTALARDRATSLAAPHATTRGSRASRGPPSVPAPQRRSARGSGRSPQRSRRSASRRTSPSRPRAASSRRRGSALRPGQWRAETGEKNYAYVVRGVQLRLAALGYLDRSDVTGSDDYLTDQALLAFQGWEDLDRTGTVTGQTQVALFTATRPKPAARRPGRRIEIYRDRGVLLMVEDGEVAACRAHVDGLLRPDARRATSAST